MNNKKETQENDDEMYFTWYMDELVNYNFIKSYQREPETFTVLPGYVHKKEKHFKTKPNEAEEFNLLQPITYTYDYRIIWDESALNIFTETLNEAKPFRFGLPTFISHYINVEGNLELVSYIDVKPHVSAARFGGKLSSYYTFPFVQKFLLNKYRLYINKAIPKNQGKFGVNTCLFAKTFTPNRYKFTDGGTQLRKIKWRVVSITSFVKKQEGIVNELMKQEEKKNSKNSQQKLL